jgi:hypothetical protein
MRCMMPYSITPTATAMVMKKTMRSGTGMFHQP